MPVFFFHLKNKVALTSTPLSKLTFHIVASCLTGLSRFPLHNKRAPGYQNPSLTQFCTKNFLMPSASSAHLSSWRKLR